VPILRRTRDLLRAARLPRPAVAVIVCAVLGALLTGLVTAATLDRGRRNAAVETNARLVTVGDAIDRQVSRYAETLYSLRAAYAHDPDLSRADFRELVGIDELIRRNPGAESIAFDRLVPTADLERFEQQVRDEVPGFTVHPAATGGEYVIVDYLEPAVPRSPALGLNIAADPVRRTAFEFARESGELSATRPIELVQSPNGAGFLLMLAAYDESPVPVTTPARVRHFLGVLVAVFEADAMIQQATETRPGLDIAIYDAGPTIDTPLTTPQADDWVVGAGMSDYTNYTDIDVGSRRWRLVTDSPVAASVTPAVATAISGTALTGLIGGLLAAAALSRRRALTLADRMTSDLRTSEERLRTANESLRGFVDVAAHDLRTPLTAIVGFSSVLADDRGALTPDERAKAMATIDRQSQYMSRLIDDLLTTSTIDGGEIITHPERLNVAQAVADCLEATDGYRHVVTVDCPSDLEVRCDPHHLGRMLDNFLQNALKYGSPPIRVDAARRGDEIAIRVSDQGSGVPAEFVPRLFAKFARAQASQRQQGTGLGLSIVRGLAEANGGRVRYEPNVPHGSRFVLDLPSA